MIIFDIAVLVPSERRDADTFVEFVKCWSAVPNATFRIISDEVTVEEMHKVLSQDLGPLDGIIPRECLRSLQPRQSYFDLIVSCKNMGSNFPVVVFIPQGKCDTNKLFSNNIHGFPIRGMLNCKWWDKWIAASSTGAENKTDTIEHRFDVNVDMAVDYTEDKKAFIDRGKSAFDKVRHEWVANSSGEERPESDLNTVSVMQALRSWDRFQRPVPLNSMVDILLVEWDDDM